MKLAVTMPPNPDHEWMWYPFLGLLVATLIFAIIMAVRDGKDS